MTPKYQVFESSVPEDQINKKLEGAVDIKRHPERRAVLVRFPDGTRRIVAEIVRLDDCPQDVFEEALEIMARAAYDY